MIWSTMKTKKQQAEALSKVIGEFFGTYKAEGGKLIIDNGEQVFEYESAEALLKDWLSTLVESQKCGDSNWSAEIAFIETLN